MPKYLRNRFLGVKFRITSPSPPSGLNHFAFLPAMVSRTAKVSEVSKTAPEQPVDFCHSSMGPRSSETSELEAQLWSCAPGGVVPGVAHGPAALASPESLSEMQKLRFLSTY